MNLQTFSGTTGDFLLCKKSPPHLFTKQQQSVKICETIRVNENKNCIPIDVLTGKYNFVTKATFVLNHKIKSVYSLSKLQSIK
mmetsp:Transcript_49422/g.49804  ORF Transcript_49422/g.49804 Transcript_49422/m.49804 type:complete len:83 (-) Transcript_49422:438-686(-)